MATYQEQADAYRRAKDQAEAVLGTAVDANTEAGAPLNLDAMLVAWDRLCNVKGSSAADECEAFHAAAGRFENEVDALIHVNNDADRPVDLDPLMSAANRLLAVPALTPTEPAGHALPG